MRLFHKAKIKKFFPDKRELLLGSRAVGNPPCKIPTIHLNLESKGRPFCPFKIAKLQRI
jgi:hypothetical protein